MHIKIKKIHTLFVISFVLAICLGSFYCAKADSEDEISEDTQKKLEELKKKAEIYRQIVEIKEKQGESISNQLYITEANLNQVQTQIELSTRQIEEYNSQIIRLESQIKEKETLIESQKKLLAEIVRGYYEVNQGGLIMAYLSKGNIASFILTKNRIAQTGDKIRDIVNSITEIKNQLKEERDAIDKKKSEIAKKTQELKDKNSNLESLKKQREVLLVQTKSEEERYRKLLANIEEQKQQLLDIERFFADSGLSLKDFPEPPSSLFASTDWYYSQRDPKWGDVKIGISGLKMKNYGCAISSVAMVFTAHKDKITPLQLVKKPIYTEEGLIAWPSKSYGDKVSLASYGVRHGNISWKVIDSQIKKDNPVIVYIKKTKGSGGHYVVIHHKESSTGKYVVHDPYFGPNIYLDTSRALVGAMGTKSGTVIDQMIIYN
jgi:peptidoglycan hydrolase CwlO-like protein